MNVKHVNVFEQMCLCLYAHVYLRHPPIVWSHLTSTTVLGQTHGNICQCQLRALEPIYIYIYIKDHLGEMFWSTITFDLSWSAFFYGSADFLICPKGSVSYLCLKQSAASCRCAQLTIWNLIGNRAYKYQTYNYWKYCSVLGLSQGGDVENYWSLIRCLSKVLCVFVKAVVSPGPTCASIEDCHIMRSPCPSL